MNSGVWQGLLPGLSKRFRVTCLDLPGHGASDYDPANSDLDCWTDACLDAAPGQAHWLGWSLGGQIAQRAALRAPDRVTSLVMVCSSPRFVSAKGWPHAVQVSTLRQFAETLKKNHGQTLIRFLSLQVQGDEQARDTLRLLRQEMDRRPIPNSRAMEDGLELLLQIDLREQLCRLCCPSLWLFGRRDTLTPAQVAEDISELGISQARYRLLEGSAHAPILSHPSQCLEAIDEFLGTIG
ncbi:MAG: pimeloyl-ACP methyl ester esterase BioH [Gammaproteobacteria bacterium]|nr:pimeloyl-ACP methyl ester esterase BioH [Gammaproteobacteria bacterium]